jgi:hypothetical protein
MLASHQSMVEVGGPQNPGERSVTAGTYIDYRHPRVRFVQKPGTLGRSCAPLFYAGGWPGAAFAPR